MSKVGWMQLASGFLLAVVCVSASLAQPGAGSKSRESVADFVAKLNAEQKQKFEQAGRAFQESRFADALGLHRELQRDFPGDPILIKFISEDALNSDQADVVLAQLKPVAAADAEDWQAVALLVRACAQTGDGGCRDAQMAHLAELRKAGLTPSRLFEYPVETVKLTAGRLEIKNSLVPWGYYKVYALGKLFDASGKLVMTVSLESNDFDQASFAKEHPTEAAQGLRGFSVDAYRETGLNSAGQRTQTHFTYKLMLVGQPEYATTRQYFLDIVNGALQPISSHAGLIVQ